MQRQPTATACRPRHVSRYTWTPPQLHKDTTQEPTSLARSTDPSMPCHLTMLALLIIVAVTLTCRVIIVHY